MMLENSPEQGLLPMELPELTPLPGASRARISARRGGARGLKASGPGYGGNTLALLASYDRATSSWKTSGCSCEGECQLSCATLPTSGMMRNGTLYPLPRLVPTTGGIASGLLPTPQARDHFPAHSPEYIAAKRGQGHGMANLNDFVAHSHKGLWPTPCTSEAKSDTKNVANRIAKGKQVMLCHAVRLWPTPTATLGTNGGLVTPAKAKEGGTLIEALSARTKWPTPTARDYKDGSANSCKNVPANGLLGRVVHIGSQASGALNPTWVEWLMGFPLEWTVLKPSETQSCRKSRKSSAKR